MFLSFQRFVFWLKKRIINRMQPLERYVGKDKNSRLWKWELDWREVSTVWGNRRLKMEKRWLWAGRGHLVPFRCSSKGLILASSGTQVAELAKSFFASLPMKGYICNEPVVSGKSHVCTDLSWECSWRCQFTNNTPTGSHKKPSDESWILLSDTTLVLTISFQTVYLKSWKKDQMIDQ